MKRLLAAIIILTFYCQTFAQSYVAQLKELDAYIVKSQKDWALPGMSVAVVKDGKVLFKKGYGTRQLGQNYPVDTQTLFSCGSTTKAMLAVCMGILVDEGKVNWNDPVVNYLPQFQLFDPFITRDLKIKDLFTHNSGLGNTDFLWTWMNIPSDEVLHRMVLVKPSYSLRSGFIYQNIFYLAAGKVIEKLSGIPWNEFISKRIFQPLGMIRTVPRLQDIHDPNQTRPHFMVHNVITVIDDLSADLIGPAGSVWSCADDITQWMICMLDSTKYSGGRLLLPATWNELFKPQVIVPASQFYPTMQILKPNWTTYGLGWFQHDYKGQKINYHTGSLPGSIAINAQLPTAKLGFYFFGNYDHAELRHALVYKTFDLFALGGNRDWSTEFLTLYDSIKAKSIHSEKEFESKRVARTVPSVPLENFAGTYSDSLYGEVTVTVDGQKLNLNVNNTLKLKMDHWHYDTFYGEYDKAWFGKAIAQFILTADGKIGKLIFESVELVRRK